MFALFEQDYPHATEGQLIRGSRATGAGADNNRVILM
jgi:hypothetical protein